MTSSTLDNLPAATLAVYQAPSANALQVSKRSAGRRLRHWRRISRRDCPTRLPITPRTSSSADIEEILRTLVITLVLVVARGLRVPAGLAGNDYPDDRHSGLADRRVRGAVCDWAIRPIRSICSRLFWRLRWSWMMRSWWWKTSPVILEEHPELTVAQATEKAMGEIIGPVIATTLVLVAVFAPVGFRLQG